MITGPGRPSENLIPYSPIWWRSGRLRSHKVGISERRRQNEERGDEHNKRPATRSIVDNGVNDQCLANPVRRVAIPARRSSAHVSLAAIRCLFPPFLPTHPDRGRQTPVLLFFWNRPD